ncbi:hypothetical protein OG594_09090 [Streptomyces sp. NBC_01214]|nr:hypothetical protein [Streptomyces sp. NBC_01214]MCX4801805.1 hypothetical protein [Streptomyces sp. NBC_01214]
MIRSAEQVNEEIRRLWAGGMLASEDVDRYHRLIVEWAAAVRAEQELAA